MTEQESSGITLHFEREKVNSSVFGQYVVSVEARRAALLKSVDDLRRDIGRVERAIGKI